MIDRYRAVVGATFALAVWTVGASAIARQTTPAPAAPQGPRTGLIAGQVVDSTGTAMPEAIVTLTTPKLADPSSPRGRVMADADGRFFFADLPAGDYTVFAIKDGYMGGYNGQRRPSYLATLSLGANERRTDVKLTLLKFAVIAGRVVDEAGEPVVGVSVRALKREIVAGRAAYGETYSFSVPTTTTDDRGVFRFSRLTPATYVIVAPATQTTVPASFLLAPDYDLRVALFRAGVQEMAPLGQPSVQQIGDWALLTMSTVLVPPRLPPSGPVPMYRTTYYPSATAATSATQIAIAAEAERTDVTITMRPVPSVRVSGRLVAPGGSAPAPMTLRLSGDATAGVVTRPMPSGLAEIGFEVATGMSDQAGRFTFIGVPPGEYTLTHANSLLSAVDQQSGEAYWVSQHITVGTSDVTDLTVAVRAPLRVDGRIEFMGAEGAQPRPASFTIAGVTLERPYGEPDLAFVSIRDGQTFSTVASGGQYIVSATERAPWVVRSITAGGKDVTDRAFDLDADTTIVVTYTDRPSKITGAVHDARGGAIAGVLVLAFPTDPQRWSGYGRSGRMVRSVISTNTGGYTFEHLPAGDYHLIAVDDPALDAEWRDPKRLEALARQATKLTVVAGQPAMLDLTVRDIR
jgi:protocatechuate 3,4-dioxygenase beta subunit